MNSRLDDHQELWSFRDPPEEEQGENARDNRDEEEQGQGVAEEGPSAQKHAQQGHGRVTGDEQGGQGAEEMRRRDFLRGKQDPKG